MSLVFSDRVTYLPEKAPPEPPMKWFYVKSNSSSTLFTVLIDNILALQLDIILLHCGAQR